MDPDKALEAFLAAVEEYDAETARKSYLELVSWLTKGGFRPTLSTEQLIVLLRNTMAKVVK